MLYVIITMFSAIIGLIVMAESTRRFVNTLRYDLNRFKYENEVMNKMLNERLDRLETNDEVV